jgi:hypothetical protein
MTFVDLTKAFDTVSRDGLWKIMSKFGCPERFICITREFHDGMMAHVRDNGQTSPSFSVSNGVKQGCVLAPTLFSLMFSAMLHDAFRNERPGMDIRVRTDGGLFNLRRFKAKTKTHIIRVCELLFADDCALVASTHDEMQKSVNLFEKACTDFGLTISTKKTEVLHQPAPGDHTHQHPVIKVNQQPLNSVERFTYLGSTLSRDASIDDEVNSRIAKASAAFGRLRSTVWQRAGIKTQTKLMVYKAVVLTTLLYGSESWTVYSRHEKKLNRFHLNCLRNLLHIHWSQHIPDTEVLTRANLPSIPTILKANQLRWAGHVSRMENQRIPKLLLFGELATGKRSQGGQRKRYKDSFKATLKDFGLDPSSWEVRAANRSSWRLLLHTRAKAHEEKRITQAQEKRRARKSRAADQNASLPPGLTCPVCQRSFKAKIGLISHLRTH